MAGNRIESFIKLLQYKPEEAEKESWLKQVSNPILLQLKHALVTKILSDFDPYCSLLIKVFHIRFKF